MGGVLFERAAAFGLMGFLLATAYYRQGTRLFLYVAGMGAALELAQLFAPGRHAQIPDAIEKMVGGALGVAAALFLARVMRAWSKRYGCGQSQL